MKNILLLATISIVLFQCSSSTKITSDYSPNADFTKYKTFEYYGWVDYSDEILSDIDKKRIESTFGAEFKARGLEYVKEGGDLIIALYITTEGKVKTSSVTTSVGVGYGAGYYGPGWGSGYSTTSVNKKPYKQGTLVCHVYDNSEEELIWEASASRTVDNNPNNNAQVIDYVVKKIMARYPVKSIAVK